jgi:hypothetical protein
MVLCNIGERLAAIPPDPFDNWPLRPRFIAVVEEIVREQKLPKVIMGEKMGFANPGAIYDLLSGVLGVKPGSKAELGVRTLADWIGVDHALLVSEGDRWRKRSKAPVQPKPAPSAASAVPLAAAPEPEPAVDPDAIPFAIVLPSALARKVRRLERLTGTSLRGLLVEGMVRDMDAMVSNLRAEIDRLAVS